MPKDILTTFKRSPTSDSAEHPPRIEDGKKVAKILLEQELNRENPNIPLLYSLFNAMGESSLNEEYNLTIKAFLFEHAITTLYSPSLKQWVEKMSQSCGQVILTGFIHEDQDKDELDQTTHNQEKSTIVAACLKVIETYSADKYFLYNLLRSDQLRGYLTHSNLNKEQDEDLIKKLEDKIDIKSKILSYHYAELGQMSSRQYREEFVQQLEAEYTISKQKFTAIDQFVSDALKDQNKADLIRLQQTLVNYSNYPCLNVEIHGAVQRLIDSKNLQEEKIHYARMSNASDRATFRNEFFKRLDQNPQSMLATQDHKDLERLLESFDRYDSCEHVDNAKFIVNKTLLERTSSPEAISASPKMKL